MLWLNILSNDVLLLIAETLVIVVGSILMGILLSYLYWGGMRKKVKELKEALEQEKNQVEDFREQVLQLTQVRTELQSEVTDLKSKSDSQTKTIYDQHQYIYAKEAELKNQKTAIDALNATIDSYQHRMRIIEEELEQTKTQIAKPKKSSSTPTIRANFEHVSKILGKQVTENDLTLITGIGPKTAALLQGQGIQTWEDLGRAALEVLQNILTGAGGIYKSQDPTHWSKQAIMASQGEWRKLRIFQETLRKME